MAKPYPYYAFMMAGLSNKQRTEILAHKLFELRSSRGLSQKAFAEKVQAYAGNYNIRFGGKYGQSLVSQYERQVCSPKIDNLVAICETFDVSPLWLCGYEPVKAGKKAA